MQEALPEVHGGKKGVLTIMHSCMCFIRSHFSILSFTWATGLVRVCYSTKIYFSNIRNKNEAMVTSLTSVQCSISTIKTKIMLPIWQWQWDWIPTKQPSSYIHNASVSLIWGVMICSNHDMYHSQMESMACFPVYLGKYSYQS